MGLLSALGLKRIELKPVDLTLASPWQPVGGMSQITIAEIWGAELANNLPLERSVAMTVPAIARGRNLLVGAIQRFPLVVLDENGPLSTQPTWAYRTSGPVTPQERIAWTVDDLIFHGVALWLRENGSSGQLLDARWHPRADWRITALGVVQAREASDSEWVDLADDDYILINAPWDGLLSVGARTIRGALSTEEAWVGRMRNPIPLIELKVTDYTELDPDEVKGHVKTWADARTGVNGAVSWTPPGMEVVTHGEVKADLYTEARNAIRTDIGSFLNVPTSMMDGSLAEASLTYSTQEGNRSRFQDESIPFWITPIEAALSMDSVVPRGQRVRFDRSEAFSTVVNPTGIPEAD
ncbi:phage portal protein [Curtobacterium sp. MCBA15_004]|uniref:phage portal protein n=1 Tax=Curtobacterium sp. MCBA15_004 TaxID=1898733 RepID=UPI0008DE7A09|nr:phage portal protein [Curtobacterium sp. MCBA15_004]WIA98034.1 phage portal protein [Curtobacterium sp. MCBA15_004]